MAPSAIGPARSTADDLHRLHRGVGVEAVVDAAMGTTAPLSRRQRVVVLLGTVAVCAIGAIPIYYRRKDRERGGNYETMAEKREAQEARKKAAADGNAR